jgi:hypothetical protein
MGLQSTIEKVLGCTKYEMRNEKYEMEKYEIKNWKYEIRN